MNDNNELTPWMSTDHAEPKRTHEEREEEARQTEIRQRWLIAGFIGWWLLAFLIAEAVVFCFDYHAYQNGAYWAQVQEYQAHEQDDPGRDLLGLYVYKSQDPRWGRFWAGKAIHAMVFQGLFILSVMVLLCMVPEDCFLPGFGRRGGEGKP